MGLPKWQLQVFCIGKKNSSDGRRVVTRGHNNALQLQLWNIQLHDAGMYKCILTNNLERISITNYLRVLGEIFKVAIRKLNARVPYFLDYSAPLFSSCPRIDRALCPSLRVILRALE